MHAQSLGNLTEFEKHDNGITIQSEFATVRVSIYSEAVVRVHISRNPREAYHSFAVIQDAGHTYDLSESEKGIEIATSKLKLRIDRNPLRFNFYTPDGRSLSEDDPRFGTTWQGESVTTYRKLYPDEKFIGLGEKTGNLNRRGSSYVNWNTDAALHDTKTDPLYKTFPFFIGLHDGLTYGLFFDNTHKSYFDFGATTDDQMSWFGAEGGDMNYYFFGAQSVAEILGDYTWLTGKMEMPPLWSLGYQQCRWSYMSSKEVLEVAGKFRKKQIPADVIYCDIDYMEGYKIFTWDNEDFPQPAEMVSQLHDMNFKLVTIVDPGIKVEPGYAQYDEGVEKNYFATYPNGEKYVASVWPGRCHFPDFFNPEVRKWWGESFKSLTEPGVDGFWNDMNEPAAWGQNMPPIVKFGEYYMPEVRNAYGLEMSKATYEGTRNLLGTKRPFVLTRAAYSGIQRYSAVWTGDNSATDEHMLLGQRLVNSLGLTGLSMIGVDIGGFTGNPTAELMLRWNSLGVYIPMFRNHAAIDTHYREPWVWGSENEKIIKKDIELRYRLLPYIYSCFYQSHESGIPVSRTLAIDYTADEHIYDERYQNQFLFGDAFLVAPVISTQTEADVYLPEGKWYRFSTGEKFSGGKVVQAYAPLTDLPVFVKGGAIVPMQNVIQSTSEKGDGILQLHIWFGKQKTSFTYYEDDGITYNYREGSFCKRGITFDPDEQLVRIAPAQGTYTSRFNTLDIVLHGFQDLKNIRLNGQLINMVKDGDIRTIRLASFNSVDEVQIGWQL